MTTYQATTAVGKKKYTVICKNITTKRICKFFNLLHIIGALFVNSDEGIPLQDESDCILLDIEAPNDINPVLALQAGGFDQEIQQTLWTVLSQPLDKDAKEGKPRKREFNTPEEKGAYMRGLNDSISFGKFAVYDHDPEEKKDKK